MFNTSLRYGCSGLGQPSIRRQGFGGHFQDAPPPFIEDNSTKDNKIERTKKPIKKVRKRKKKVKLSSKE